MLLSHGVKLHDGSVLQTVYIAINHHDLFLVRHTNINKQFELGALSDY